MASGAVENLIAHWHDLPADADDWIHPDDLDVLVDQRWSHLVRWDYPEQADLVRGHPDRAAHMHAHLIPQPYVGDIRNAGIVLCLLNPGVDLGDYISERPGTEFRHRKIANLRQEGIDSRYPFFEIDPDLAGSGAFRWWWPRLRKVVEAMVADRHYYDDAVAIVAREVCSVELVPYHSGTAPPGYEKLVRCLRSSRLAVEAVRERAGTSGSVEPLVLVFRGHRSWDLPDDGQRVRHVPAGRSIAFGAETTAGGLISEWMRRNYPADRTASAKSGT